MCCFVDMHSYSKNRSNFAIVSSLEMLKLFPPCFSCKRNFNPSECSLGLHDKNLGFDSFWF